MKISYKALSVFLSIAVVALIAMAVALVPHSSSASLPPTSHAIITPEQGQYIQMLGNYIKQLDQDGLQVIKQVHVEEGEPFIFILKPQNGREITEEDAQHVADLVVHTASVFESRAGLRSDDIDMPFHRPAGQNIILIKRETMSEFIGDEFGEASLVMDERYFTSLVNLAGPPKNGRQDFANAWYVIQAVCLAYAGNFVDSDPVCNIISANAAAGWVGMEQDEAAQIINGYGMTELASLGNKDYRYRFIDFVYQDFKVASSGGASQ